MFGILARLLPFDASKKMNMSIFRRSRVVVDSNRNCNHGITL